MRFMNEYEIEEARDRYAEHPVLGPATETLANLRDAANMNSDGWAYWPKPARAAAKLMDLIERDGTARYRFDSEREDATVAELRKALAPIKAFRTRSGIAFEIVEQLPEPTPTTPAVVMLDEVIQDAFARTLRERGADLAADRLELLDADQAWESYFGPVADQIEETLQ